MTHIVSTAGLTADIRAKLAAVRATNPRATARVLGGGDINTIAAAVRRAIREAGPDDVAATVDAVGGVVPNGYARRGGPAAADRVFVVVDLALGTWTVSAERGKARTAANGRGSWLVAHARRAGQTQGRRLFSE